MILFPAWIFPSPFPEFIKDEIPLLFMFPMYHCLVLKGCFSVFLFAFGVGRRISLPCFFVFAGISLKGYPYSYSSVFSLAGLKGGLSVVMDSSPLPSFFPGLG
jgi:hypothetical protein